MIDVADAKRVAETAGNNLIGVSHDSASFRALPGDFWGYYAKGHDAKGKFAFIITYSEKGDDVEDLIAKYEEWVRENKAGAGHGPHPQ